MKKAAAAVMALAAGLTLLAGSAVSTLAAVNYTTSTIDSSRTGSMTIYKYVNNTDTDKPGTGLGGQTVSHDASPLAGVRFSYLKVAEITQKTKAGKSAVYASDVSPELMKLAGDLDLEMASTSIDGKTCYLTGEMDRMINGINAYPAGDGTETGATQLTKLLSKSGTALSLTDTDGKTEVSSLPLGLYLVGETDVSEAEKAGKLIMPLSPFLVMLPMTNIAEIDGHAAGTVWQYDVTLYPKNRSVGISKGFVPEDKSDTVLKTATDRNVGDIVNQVITADIPVLPDGSSTRVYKIYDTMTPGLSFVKVNKVTFGSGTWNDPSNVTLEENKDYVVSKTSDQAYVLTLTSTGLAAIDTVTDKSFLYVDLDGRLNGNAGIGINLNTTTPELSYATNTTEEKLIEGNTPQVAAYEIDLTKISGKTGVDLTTVAFTLSRGDAEVAVVKIGEGIYRVKDEADTLSKAEIMSPDSKGLLKIKGLDAGTYSIKEVKTAEGLILLKAPITVALTASDAIDGSLKKATVAVGSDTPLALDDKAGLAMGVAGFSVTNGAAIPVPHTGGQGSAGYMLFGFMLLGIIGTLTALQYGRKKIVKA